MTPHPLLAPSPQEQVARKAGDRDFLIGYARECLDKASRLDDEIKQITREMAERAALRRDRTEVRRLAGGPVVMKGE